MPSIATDNKNVAVISEAVGARSFVGAGLTHTV
jgi:hypothetical protein